MIFDPMYFVFLAPALALAAWAQWRVHSTYAEASRIRPHSNLNGAQAAEEVLRAAGVNGVRIEAVDGVLTDHYVPGEGVLRLSPGVYGEQSLAALGIAAHEAGHAIQDATRYPLLGIRNAVVPLAGFGSGVGVFVILAGFLLQLAGLIYLGIALFSMVVLFQLVNLPVEFDASRRARIALVEGGLVTRDEDEIVGRVLRAAAWTYVAATLTSILTLLYYLFRAGALSQREE
jgi:Zn-dependent membrane protease YugP